MEHGFIIGKMHDTGAYPYCVVGTPKVHGTFKEAVAEAERLCSKERKQFVVFRPVALVEPADCPVTVSTINVPSE